MRLYNSFFPARARGSLDTPLNNIRYPCNSTFSAEAIRVKRQSSSSDDSKKEESFEAEICKDKDAGEWFRLVAGEGDNCRDVIQCTSSVSTRVKSAVFEIY